MRKLRFREVQPFVKIVTGTGAQTKVYLESKLPSLITSKAISLSTGAGFRTCCLPLYLP